MMITPYTSLKNSKRYGVKAVEVITDHQAIFRDNRKGNYSHAGIVSDIEKDIYPQLTEMEIAEREDQNVYIFLSDDEAIIHFPYNGKVSYAQTYFIMDFIKDVTMYNREVSLKEKVPIGIDWSGKYFSIYDILEIDEKKAKIWNKLFRESYELDHEVIIGKTYSNKEKNSFKR